MSYMSSRISCPTWRGTQAESDILHQIQNLIPHAAHKLSCANSWHSCRPAWFGLFLTNSYWLHLFDFSPLCHFKCALGMCAKCLQSCRHSCFMIWPVVQFLTRIDGNVLPSQALCKPWPVTSRGKSSWTICWKWNNNSNLTFNLKGDPTLENSS